jgi:hypothetical protein
MIILNFLANFLPINNKSTAELSGQYPNLFVPAGYTFSIWGAIYLLLLSFIIYQLLCAFSKKKPSDFIGVIRYWFFFSCLANAGWILAWHYEKVILSLAIMLFLLFSLIIIYDSLNIGKSIVPRMEKNLVHIPFSVYFAWINVATFANMTIAFVDAGWEPPVHSAQWLTIVILGLIVILTLFYLYKRRDMYFLMIILWAFTGILVKRIRDTNLPDSAMEWMLIISLVLLVGTGMIRVIRKKVY